MKRVSRFLAKMASHAKEDAVVRLLAREAGYVKEDISKIRAAVTPARRAAFAILVGVCLVVYAIAQWQPVVAGALGGIALVAYGLLADVDVSEEGGRRRRRRA